MDKGKALAAVERRAFNARKAVHVLCQEAGVGYSTVCRWRRDPSSITPGPLKRLEDRLDAIEAERAGV